MRRLNVSLLILMVLFNWAWGQTAPEFGQIWHPSDQNPTHREYRVDGTWNEGGIGFATWGHAMWDGEQYRLYVSGRGPDLLGTTSIGLFLSPHLDSAWVAHANNPIFEASPTNWDSTYVATPMVMKDGDTYKMWYSAWNGDDDDWHFGYAESADGIAWTRHASPILSNDVDSEWDAYWGLTPYVVKEDESTYTMYYAGLPTNGFPWKIGCAHSTDGINWTREVENPVLGVEGQWSTDFVHIPVVKKIDEKYVMWFAGATVGASRAQMGTAISSDGIHWRKDQLYNPIQPQGPSGSWNEVGVYPLEVFEEDGEYKLYYGGIDQSWDYVGYGYSDYNPTLVSAGDVSGTWTKADSPIRVQGEITIPDGETLTIEPGTTVEFLGHDPLNVQGQILAVGTEDEPIRFMVDDSLGFYNNAGSDGVWGGVRFDGTSATNDSSFLKYCEIAYAKTFAGGGAALDGDGGGGLLINNFSKVRVEQCLIQNNRAIGDVAGTYAFGGGIAILNYAAPEIINNVIQNNTAMHLVDLSKSTGGGMMVWKHCNPRIHGNTIRFNRATETGGGLSIWDECYPLVTANLIVENVCLKNDGAGGAGGGLAIGWDGRPVFINNTIVDNVAGWIAGGFYSNGGDAVFINSIIANNRDVVEPYEGHDIGTYNMSGHTFDFQNSCLEGGEASIHWDSSVGTVSFVESISIDPELRFDFTLNRFYSQCIGAGTSSCEIDGVTYHAPSTDLNGDPCPSPAGSSPDMGAFELDRSGHHIHSGWNWWHWAESPVLMPGPNGTWDDANIFAPDVLFYEEQYHMWYVGSDGDRYKIGHATSDNGVDWLRDPANPVLTSEPTSWQAQNLNVPRVLLVGDTLHMWFWTDGRAGHATSTDGISWTFTPDPVMEGTLGTWDGGMVVIADVIYRDSVFHAWYTGESSGVYAIGYATSTDGIVWDKLADPVFESSASGWDGRMYYASSVVWDGDYFWMWYCAKENTEPARIGRAYSMNGINWTRASTAAPDIGYGEPGSWNAAASFYPAVLLDQGRYKVWFNGVPTVNSAYRIGYASMEPVAADPKYVEIPQSFMLSQNYPNPFNPMTHIRYSLPENGDIRLVVYDVLGKEIVELVNDYRSVGDYETSWYGMDRNGNQVSTGVYFARLESGRNVDVIKMLYLK